MPKTYLASVLRGRDGFLEGGMLHEEARVASQGRQSSVPLSLSKHKGADRWNWR